MQLKYFKFQLCFCCSLPWGEALPGTVPSMLLSPRGREVNMDFKKIYDETHVNWLNLVLAVVLACASAFAMNWRDWHPDVFTGRSLIGFVLLAVGAFRSRSCHHHGHQGRVQVDEPRRHWCSASSSAFARSCSSRTTTSRGPKPSLASVSSW